MILSLSFSKFWCGIGWWNLAKVEQNGCISSHHIVNKSNIHDQRVLNHLKKTDHKKRLNVRVRCGLTRRNVLDHVFTCKTLQECNEIQPFQKRLITGYKTRITYDTEVREKYSSQSVAKPELTPTKLMLTCLAERNCARWAAAPPAAWHNMTENWCECFFINN